MLNFIPFLFKSPSSVLSILGRRQKLILIPLVSIPPLICSRPLEEKAKVHSYSSPQRGEDGRRPGEGKTK